MIQENVQSVSETSTTSSTTSSRGSILPTMFSASGLVGAGVGAFYTWSVDKRLTNKHDDLEHRVLTLENLVNQLFGLLTELRHKSSSSLESSIDDIVNKVIAESNVSEYPVDNKQEPLPIKETKDFLPGLPNFPRRIDMNDDVSSVTDSVLEAQLADLGING